MNQEPFLGADLSSLEEAGDAHTDTQTHSGSL